ncbi:cold-shock protein [Ancylomarina sp. 16SWW S1-10-2]|uniref:cold-shock protein n=1 Tax=Ancylomarina sp. 16SWW S1-10-2 TaxID=2499681 RepID=UPI0012ADD46C|nr:cold shock domain-containing protein [Ancylomarina sp. 16SWW S1-10-2]MRT94818.1 cold shock domain-containing protein [Ancylomarina sp. 16SWW S1-10-2]
MPQGTVKFFNETKGFGFIKNSETDEDVFVHATGLIDKINEGDVVSFDVVEGKKGMNAVNVKID